MRRALACAALVLAAAACGDNGASVVDASTAPGAQPDAAACTSAIPVAPWLFVETTARVHLDLDGVGTRCEQAIRAVPQLTRVVPGADQLLEDTPHDTFCTDGGEFSFLSFAGPILPDDFVVEGAIPTWSVNGILFSDDTIEMSGNFYHIDLPGPACLDRAGVQLEMVGRTITYLDCLLNAYTYETAPGDVFHVADEVIYFDNDLQYVTIHRSRQVRANLLPSHVTPAMMSTGLNCCADHITPVDCVGANFRIETISGETLSQARACFPRCVVQ